MKPRCPYCNSEYHEFEEHEFDGKWLITYHTCSDCNGEFQMRWKLKEFILED